MVRLTKRNFLKKGYEYHLIAAIIFFGCSQQSTKGVEMKNDLAKFSYALCTMTGSQAHNGTGFLYKKGENVYVVTNYHIRGMNPIDRKSTFDATSLYLKIPLKDGINSYEILNIPIDKEEVGGLRLFSFLDELDMFALKLKTIPVNAALHFINELIDPKLFDSIPQTVSIYGFPPYEEKQKQILDVKLDTFHSTYENGTKELEENLLLQGANRQFIDPVVNFHSQNYFFISARAHGGNSGAPIIGEYNVNGKVIYALAGMVFGWSVLEKTWCIKAKSVHAYLESLQ
jgi:hypothetical protein